MVGGVRECFDVILFLGLVCLCIFGWLGLCCFCLAFLCCSEQASHCNSSRWGEQAPAPAPRLSGFSPPGCRLRTQAQGLPALDTGSGAVAHRLGCPVVCGILLDQGSNLCLLHWQADSLPLSRQGSPVPCSVQFSRSVVSDSLRPHGLQHARLPCLSPTPGACSNSCPSSQCCHSIPSSPAFNLSHHQGLFQ